ncbi:MAG TPA: hypothetical protein VNX28_07515, partial [Gemmataceae bacterium]|nr:hypothetical protein [Gemmataceae bacterium]
MLRSIFVAVLVVHSVEARPAHKNALAQYFGPFLPRKLNDCRTCHLPDKPGTAVTDPDYEKPHNAFGARLKKVKDELRQGGQKTTIESRLDAILDEDADGDGVSNLLEILSGHNPGEKDDRPTASELADAEKLFVLFTKFRKSYPWRPFEAVQRPALPT